MKRRIPVPGTLRFVFIAIVLMLLADQFIFGGKRSYIEDAKHLSQERKEQAAVETPKPPPVRVDPGNGKEFFEAPPMQEPLPPEEVATAPKAPEPTPAPIVTPTQKQTVLPRPAVEGRPKISIIIDDIGMDLPHSKEAINLPAPITMAFLPYATRTPELAKIAKANGHTTIIHVPMEAMDAKLNIGPGGLKTSMSDSEFDAAFGVMLSSFDGYEGINNHMGSRLTQDKDKMDRLMTVLGQRNLFFVDSKTVGSSVAAHEAASSGVPYAERDIFLDHIESAAFVKGALENVERTAQRKGYAIAIGHPKKFTLDALKEWIPTLEAKGFELVSVKSLLVTPKAVSPVATKTEEVIAPSVDMFPEEVTPSATLAPVPESQPHQPPEQSPAP